MAPDAGYDRSDDQLPQSVVDDLVGSRRRRALLRHLAERDEPVSLTDLAAALSADEAGMDPEDVPRESRRAVRQDIYERHLPKLTATDVVEYDSMRGTLTLLSRRVADRVS